MGKIVGLLFVVGLIWVGMEFYSKGTDGAFGGVFAGALDPVSDYEASPDGRSPTQRIEDRVRADIESGARRSTRGIDR